VSGNSSAWTSGGQYAGVFSQHLEGQSESSEGVGHGRPMLTGMTLASSFSGYQLDLQLRVKNFGHALQEGEGW
jgi:hypothetical protein